MTYTVGATTRHRQPPSAEHLPGDARRLAASPSPIPSRASTFTFDSSGNNPVTAEFVYTNHFFIDAITGVTYYIDEADNRVEAISYLPETTQYAFTAGRRQDLSDPLQRRPRRLPGDLGRERQRRHRHRRRGHLHRRRRRGRSGPRRRPRFRSTAIRSRSTATSTRSPARRPARTTRPARSSATRSAPHALHVGRTRSSSPTRASPTRCTSTPRICRPRSRATFPVKPSRDLITVNDDVYIITYNTVSTGSLLGPGPGVDRDQSTPASRSPIRSTRPRRSSSSPT